MKKLNLHPDEKKLSETDFYTFLFVMIIIAMITVSVLILPIKKEDEKVVEKSTSVDEVEQIEKQTTNNSIDYRYFDQFIDYLHNNSEAYDNASEEFMIQAYNTWYTNRGYSDIIIDINGNLTDTNDDMSIYDIIPSCYTEMPEGIYTWYGNGFSMIATIEYINKEHSGGIINLSGYSSTGEQSNSFTSVFYKTANFDENDGYYTTGPYINFKFNKELQQLKIVDTTVNFLEAQQNTEEQLENYEIDFSGYYDFVFPYVYNERDN